MLDRRTAGIFALMGAALLVGSVPSERWRSWLLFTLGLLALGFSVFCLFGDRLWHRPRLRIHSPHIEPRFRQKTVTVTPNPGFVLTTGASGSPGVSITTSANEMPGIVPRGPFDDPMHYAYVKVENVGKSGCPLATKVVASLDYSDKTGGLVYRLHGRWSDSSTMVTPQTLLRAKEIELAANENPAVLDVACMYDGDTHMYASTDENIHYAPDDLRHNELPTPCAVRVTVRSAECSPISERFVVDLRDGQLCLSVPPKVAWYRRAWSWIKGTIHPTRTAVAETEPNSGNGSPIS